MEEEILTKTEFMYVSSHIAVNDIRSINWDYRFKLRGLFFILRPKLVREYEASVERWNSIWSKIDLLNELLSETEINRCNKIIRRYKHLRTLGVGHFLITDVWWEELWKK